MSRQTSTADTPRPESGSAQSSSPVSDTGEPADTTKPITVVEELVDQIVEGVAHALTKPRFRGWIHVYSAGVAVVAGAVLVAVSWSLESTRAGLATLVYAIITVLMFAVSATYHRVQWKSKTAVKWMKRADHSMIFVFIAANYTPFALLAMPGDTGTQLLTIVWAGAIAGVILKMSWPSAPRWVGVPLYLLLGFVSIFYAVPIVQGAGVTSLVLLATGGGLYAIGAYCYAMRKPDRWAATFGYHEFFHAFTAAAATCHYIAIWFAVF